MQCKIVLFYQIVKEAVLRDIYAKKVCVKSLTLKIDIIDIKIDIIDVHFL